MTQGDCQGGCPLGWLSGDSFSIERVTLGARGAERPRIREGPPKAAHKFVSQRPPVPTRPRQRAKPAGGPQGRSGAAAKPPTGPSSRDYRSHPPAPADKNPAGGP